MTINNYRLLKLEGHDLKLGWNGTKFIFYQKIPKLVSPLEAFTQPMLMHRIIESYTQACEI